MRGLLRPALTTSFAGVCMIGSTRPEFQVSSNGFQREIELGRNLNLRPQALAVINPNGELQGESAKRRGTPDRRRASSKHHPNRAHARHPEATSPPAEPRQTG